MDIKDEMGALRERLAALEHEQWAHWTRYMLSVLGEVIGLGFYEARDNDLDTEGLKNARESLERWKRQIDTRYLDLSEEEKESDREWANRAISLAVPTMQAVVHHTTEEMVDRMTAEAKKLPVHILIPANTATVKRGSEAHHSLREAGWAEDCELKGDLIRMQW